MTIMS